MMKTTHSLNLLPLHVFLVVVVSLSTPLLTTAGSPPPLPSTGNWTQVGQSILGTSSGDDIVHVLLNDAGDTYVQSLLDGGSGTVRVFSLIEGIWTQVGSSIVPQTSSDRTGEGLAINGAGNRIAVGSPLNLFGSVRIFENIAGTWTQIGELIGINDIRQFGRSVALNSAGDVIVIGAQGTLDIGSVHVYAYSGGNWIQMGSDILGTEFAESHGWSVAINSAGDVIATGSTTFGVGGRARAFTFNETSGDWEQIGSDISALDNAAFCGASIHLNDVGDRVAVSCPGDDGASGTDSGAVRVFSNTGGGEWVQLGPAIRGRTTNDQLGSSMSFNAVGNALIASSYVANGGFGYAEVRRFDGSDWTQVGDDIVQPAFLCGKQVAMNGVGDVAAFACDFTAAFGSEGMTSVFELE